MPTSWKTCIPLLTSTTNSKMTVWRHVYTYPLESSHNTAFTLPYSANTTQKITQINSSMYIKPKPTQKSLIHDVIHCCLLLKRSSSPSGHFVNEKGSTLVWGPLYHVQGLTPPKQPPHLCAIDHSLKLSHTAGD